ncbi:MAG: T9SS type A sorting domain-containing protein [Candidatus Kapabacteria bacterium]|nr:T9SS type A sorting domain-containing protein [Candidatus Kapabacteria bacterium]
MKKILNIYIILIILSSVSFAKINNLVFEKSECGLKIAYAFQKVTNRYTIPPGSGIPCKLKIDSLPERCYEIIDAFIWTTLSDSISKNEPISLMVINPRNKADYYYTTKTGQQADKCWGELHTSGYRASVKNSITGNGEYIISTNASEWEVDGFFLLIIYKDYTDEYEGHITIMDGLSTEQAGRSSFDTLKFKPVCDFSGEANFFSVVSDMQFGYFPQYVMNMNGTDHYVQCNFWNVEFRKSNVFKDQTSSAFAVKPMRNDCYSWILSGLYYRTKTCRNCYLPTINITAKGSDICPGDSVLLTADGGFHYEWSSIPEGFVSNKKDVYVRPKTTTRYIIKGMTEDSCFKGYDTVLVTVNPKPKAAIIPEGPINFCRGDSVVLRASPSDNNHTALWSDNSKTSRITIKESGNYTLIVENQFGCKDTTSIDITVYENPKVKILNDNDFRVCLGDSIELISDKNFINYRWSTGQTTKSIFVKYPGIFHLSVTDSNGCKAYDTVLVKPADLTLSYLNKINLDSVCIGDKETYLLNIHNSGTDNYSVTDIIFLKADSNLKISTNIPIPTNLNPGDSIKVLIEFTPDEIRNYSDSIKIFLEKAPCKEIKTVYVNAIGVPRFQLSIPDTVGYVKDENFCFPVFIKLLAKENTSLVIDYQADISFDPYVFLPKIPFRIVNDKRIVSLSGRNFQVTTEPKLLAEICGLVMLGDSLTKTQIERFNYKNSKICLETLNGNFAITGICAIKSSRVVLLKEAKLNISPNPADDKVEISVNTENSGEHRLTIYNIQGEKIIQEIANKNNNLSEDLLFNFDLKNFSNGLYYVILYNENNIIKKPLIILK